jgi:hypothetical protein
VQDAILRKLAEHLRLGIKTECQVVYLLAEIRKLLDREEDKDGRYHSLRMYCNWALHIELENKQAQEIVRTIDALYPKIIQENLTKGEKDEIRAVFTLDRFRGELSQFLRKRELPDFSDAEWNSFLACFLNVIQDCPLLCKPREIELKRVDEVVLISEVADPQRKPDGSAPPIIWALCFKGNHINTIGANFDLTDQVIDAMIDFSRKRGG